MIPGGLPGASRETKLICAAPEAPNRGPRGSKWAPGGLPGVERQSFEAEAVFEAILEAILTPPWGLQNREKELENGSRNRSLFSDAF